MTVVLLVKLVLAPLLVAVATLAGRRWGPGVSGWVTGFPLTSGPVSLFLALEQGPAFAIGAASGTLLGLLATAVFCLVYARLAHRAAWPASATAAAGAFAVCTVLLKDVALPVVPAFVLVCALLVATSAAMPAAPAPGPAGTAPPWDLPARMAMAIAMVLLVTGIAPRLGPTLSGVTAQVPVLVLILAAFAHRAHGARAPVLLLRAVVVGSLAFAAFFLVVGTALPRIGIAPTYLLAAGSALAVNGAVLLFLRRGS